MKFASLIAPQPPGTISLWQVMLFDSILPTVEVLSKSHLILSNPAAILQLSLWNILNPLLPFQQSSPRVDSISRNHFLCSFIRNSSSVEVLSWHFNNSVTPLGSTSNSGSLAISTTSAVTSSYEVLTPHSYHDGWNQLLPNACSCW